MNRCREAPLYWTLTDTFKRASICSPIYIAVYYVQQVGLHMQPLINASITMPTLMLTLALVLFTFAPLLLLVLLLWWCNRDVPHLPF